MELVENRDYTGSSHFFFDIGNRNLLGFFGFPGHDHPDFSETIGAVQHLALSASPEQFANARENSTQPGSSTWGPTAACRTVSTSVIRTAWASSSTASSSASSRASLCWRTRKRSQHLVDGHDGRPTQRM